MVLQFPRCNILGVYVSAIDMEMAIHSIQGWIERKAKNYVCVTPAHSIMDAYHDSDFKNILNKSGLTTPDGMAVVWLLKLHGFRNAGRVYGPDLMLAVCEESVKHNWTHFLYGGAPGVGDQLASKLQTRFPGLKISGVYSPPFRQLNSEEDKQIAVLINRTQADIIWVGISSPKQEKWMEEHIERLNSTVLIGVGAAFDFISGSKPQAPKWIQRSGLEWLFRFIQEPGRLWKRYGQYPFFVILVISQFLHIKRFSEKS